MATRSQDPPALYHLQHAPHVPPPGAVTSTYHQQLPASFKRFQRHSSSAETPSNAFMNPTLPQLPPQFSYQRSPHHGVKRTAPDPDDELERSSHISTQFKKLRLNNQTTGQRNHNNSDQDHAHAQSGYDTYHEQPSTYSTASDFQPSQRNHESTNTSALPNNDFMTVDETPHKIYISSISDELASIEGDEETSHLHFPADISRQISAIPDHVLRSNRAALIHERSPLPNRPDDSQALILYREPSSISVPAEEDAVRKTILDARRGIREKMRRESQRERENARVDSTSLLGGRSGVGDWDSSDGLPRSTNESLGGRVDRFGGSKGDMTEHEADDIDDGDAMDIE